MSEFSNNSYDQLDQTRQAMDQATAIVAEAAGETDPFKIFPNPKDFKRRADIVWNVQLSDEQEATFRSAMSEVGPGRATDIGPIEAGFENRDHTLILEGGQPHKMVAQLRVARSGGRGVLPTAIYQTASIDREIEKNEREFMAAYLGCDESEVADTELGVAEQIVRHETDFQPWPEDNEAMPVKELQEAAEGSLMQPYLAGHFSNPNPKNAEDQAPVNVFLVGVKKIYRTDGSGKYDQASSGDKVEQVIGLSANTNFGFVTSATYQPSNVVEMTDIMRRFDVNAKVLSYGIDNLAEVKGTDPTPPNLPDLGAEAYKTAELLQKS